MIVLSLFKDEVKSMIPSWLSFLIQALLFQALDGLVSG
jgi:hypothetical protein